MVVNYKGKNIELKFTFNSFKYMTDFSVKEFEDVQDKPFKLVPIAEMLLMGALNNDRKKKYTYDDVENILVDYSDKGELTGLLEDLLNLLQESGFFKNLQK